MGILDIFSTSEKAVETASDAVKAGMAGIDKLFFTEEEKADYAQKRGEIVYKFAELGLKKTEQTMNESSAQTLSRRYMAWFIVFNAGAMSWVYIFAEMLSDVATDRWFKLSTATFKMLDYWEYALTAVVMFYFLAHAGRAMMGGKK